MKKIFLVLLCAFSASAFAQEPNYLEKAKGFGGDVVDFTKKGLQNERLHGAVDEISDAMIGTFIGVKEGIFPSDSMCLIMEDNYKVVMDNEQFMNTGFVIQVQAEKHDPFAIALIKRLQPLIKNPANPLKQSDEQLEQKELFYNDATIDQVGENWAKFFSKELTWPIGTYRCTRDNMMDKDYFVNIINGVGNYMITLPGHENWFDNFNAMLEQMKAKQ